MADLSLKIVPKSRAQRRELDRAASSAGLKTGPWCLSVALAAARVAVGASAATPASTAAFQGHGRVTGTMIAEAGTGIPGKPVARQPLTKSFDPDA